MFSLDLGAGLSLRLFHATDADELFRLVDANRDHLQRWLPEVAATTHEATADYVRRSMERWARDEGFFSGICVDGTLVGTLGAGLDKTNRCASLGYWVARTSEGRGVVTRSVQAVTDHYLRQREMQRVELRAQPGNSRSRAVAERCGFKLEGTLRQSAWLHDRFVDHCVYAILREEWLARS